MKVILEDLKTSEDLLALLAQMEGAGDNNPLPTPAGKENIVRKSQLIPDFVDSFTLPDSDHEIARDGQTSIILILLCRPSRRWVAMRVLLQNEPGPDLLRIANQCFSRRRPEHEGGLRTSRTHQKAESMEDSSVVRCHCESNVNPPQHR
ncbi:Hypp2371 [Branchiostoma lanceolatum]|uniref:Hypp2371 protein n=1 Tax=Branchiostoma lanceolatum TaxID=7740 RepID=A0A8K0EPJ2_BRALA|nr:Hypp2371 [Branchiostoma lanceolatum]